MGIKMKGKQVRKKGEQKKHKQTNFAKKRRPKLDHKPEENVRIESEPDDDASSGSSDVEEMYEQAPRLSKTVKVRNLLPVKNKGGVVFRSEVVAEEIEEEVPTQEKDEVKIDKQNLIQSYTIQQKLLKDLKQKVALLCTSVIGDPDNHMSALRELVSMLENPVTQMIVSEKRILCLSLLHVFLDIIPGYKIRAQDEKESKVKLRKETKKLLGYEQTLLKSYRTYIDLLHNLIRKMKYNITAKNVSINNKKASYEVGVVAVKCLCQLLSKRFAFNYFRNIANKLVPLAIDCDDKITSMCCQSFERLFKSDKLGEASLNLVKQIINVIKERQFCIPVRLLDVFLSLNLKEAKVEVEKVDMRKGRKEWQNMSKTKRRDKKKIKDLEAELKEAQAYENVESVQQFHTATLNRIFWVYFHVLKDGQKISLFAPALRGLSNFAYLINLEFFDDLNLVLCSMMESGKLSDVEKLHGVYTLFTILAGQAESLHIDPHQIYCHMYQSLLNLSHSTNVEHFDLSLKCLEFNIVRKKKKISFSRILAFTKRICTVSLQTPVYGSMGLLATVRNILLNIKGSDVLLDSESTLGNGIFSPEMEDPEHCNAQSTTLWELNLLRLHYNPAIKLYAQHLSNSCSNQGRSKLPDKLANSTPEEILHLFQDLRKNKMDFIQTVQEPPKKKLRVDPYPADLSYENNVDIHIDSEILGNVNFFQI